MATINVKYLGGKAHEIEVRGHTLLVDQPRSLGGEDIGPTPVELFVASLAACACTYAEGYLNRHNCPTEELAVEADYTLSVGPPSRVESIRLRMRLPKGFPAEDVDRIMRVVKRCSVHNSIEQAPQIEFLTESTRASGSGEAVGVGRR